MGSLFDAISIAKPTTLEVIDLDDEAIIKLSNKSTSKGNQQKWYDVKNKRFIKEQFFYQNKYWKDYMVEYLATVIAGQCNFENVVKQEIVKLSNGRYATVSKDFCEEGFRFVPVSKFVDKSKIEEMYGWSYKMYDYLIKIASDLGVDWSTYLGTMILMDFLLGNEDRHINNFGLLLKGSEFKVAPLFDFGLGLFEHDLIYEGKPLDKCKSHMTGLPFNENLKSPVNMLLNTNFDFCKKVSENLTLPSRELFPTDNAYEYMRECIDYLKGRCS